MFLEKLKLQLFAESEENQEVAELGTEETQTTEVEKGAEGTQSTSGEVTEVAGQSTDDAQQIQQPLRDFEKDSAFAKMRREAEQIKKQNEMLAKTFQQFGFQGTPEEIIDQANAHYLQKPIEEVRQQRIESEKKQQEESKLQADLEFYRNRELERIMADDLKTIQKLDPTVKSLNDLGEDYFNLIQAGVAADIAYAAVQQKKQRETITAPPEIGKVNSNSTAEKDYYTPEEVDKLNPNDLDNPKIWEKVRNSMTKWK